MSHKPCHTEAVAAPQNLRRCNWRLKFHLFGKKREKIFVAGPTRRLLQLRFNNSQHQRAACQSGRQQGLRSNCYERNQTSDTHETIITDKSVIGRDGSGSKTSNTLKGLESNTAAFVPFVCFLFAHTALHSSFWWKQSFKTTTMQIKPIPFILNAVFCSAPLHLAIHTVLNRFYTSVPGSVNGRGAEYISLCIKATLFLPANTWMCQL